MRRVMFAAALTLVVYESTAFGQTGDATLSRVNEELGKRFRDGTGKLTAAEVLKLLPVAYTLEPGTGETSTLTCAETIEFVVEFTDGKLSFRSATFHPAVESKNLTLENFHKLKIGMTEAEVEKLLGTQNRSGRDIPSKDENQESMRWRWVHGREVVVYLTEGKVSGGGFMEYVEK